MHLAYTVFHACAVVAFGAFNRAEVGGKQQYVALAGGQHCGLALRPWRLLR